MSKRSKKTKERSLWVYAMATSDGKGQLEIRRDPATGMMSFPTAVPGSVKSVMSYERSGTGDKVVFEYPSSGNTAYLSEYQQIKANFDVLAAVDTNTVVIEGLKLSVGCVYYTPEGIGNSDESCLFDLVGLFVLANVREGINPEPIGWHCFLSGMWPQLKTAERPRLGLIVDSELGQHKDYNGRLVPYYSNHKLPEDVHVLYASADVGGGLTNKVIRVCDETSSRTAHRIFTDTALLARLRRLCNGNEDFESYIIEFYPQRVPGEELII